MTPSQAAPGQPTVAFLCMSPKHSSATRRMIDSKGGPFNIVFPDFGIDKVHRSIAQRLIGLDYLPVLKVVLNPRHDVIWAWGHDVCFIASIGMLFTKRRRLIWDISDINLQLLQPTLKSKLLRIIERLLVRRADRLFLTSAGFYDTYYKFIVEERKVNIIENKKNEIPEMATTTPARSAPPWVIVYAGIFRSTAMVKLILAVAKALGHNFRFHLHGCVDRNTDISPLVLPETAQDNVVYFGSYTSDELPGIYQAGHIVWGFTDAAANLNERILLTNRIYDAMAYCRPIITNEDTFSGVTVLDRTIGVTSKYSVDGIVAALSALAADDGRKYAELVATMPSIEGAYLLGAYRNAVADEARRTVPE